MGIWSMSFLISLLVGELMWLGRSVEAGVVAYSKCSMNLNGMEIPLCDLEKPNAIFFKVPSFQSCSNLCGQYNFSAENPFTDLENIKNTLFTETRLNDTTRLFTSHQPNSFSTFSFEEEKNILMFGELRLQTSKLPPVPLINYAFNLGCVAFNYESHTKTCFLFKTQSSYNLLYASTSVDSLYHILLLTDNHTEVYANERILPADRPSGYSCSSYQMSVYPGQSCYIGRTKCGDYELQSPEDNGVYYLSTPLGVRPVYCHYSIIEGSPMIGMLIQRRLTGLENFNRNWTDYENGFGDLEEDHWLGNRVVSSMTNLYSYKLVVEMVSPNDSYAYAMYNSFVVAGEPYQLTVSGYTGTAGDSLSFHNGARFATADRVDVDKCARYAASGWWFNSCFWSNLNGFMTGPGPEGYEGASWITFETKNKECLMKIV